MLDLIETITYNPPKPAARPAPAPSSPESDQGTADEVIKLLDAIEKLLD